MLGVSVSKHAMTLKVKGALSRPRYVPNLSIDSAMAINMTCYLYANRFWRKTCLIIKPWVSFPFEQKSWGRRYFREAM